MSFRRLVWLGVLLGPLACDVNKTDGDGCSGCTSAHNRTLGGGTITSGTATLDFADRVDAIFVAQGASTDFVSGGADGLTFYRVAPAVRIRAEAGVLSPDGDTSDADANADADAGGASDASDEDARASDAGDADADNAEAGDAGDAGDAEAGDADAGASDESTFAAPVARLSLPQTVVGDGGPTRFHLTRCASYRGTLGPHGCLDADGTTSAPDELDVDGTYFVGPAATDQRIHVDVPHVRIDWSAIYAPPHTERECL